MVSLYIIFFSYIISYSDRYLNHILILMQPLCSPALIYLAFVSTQIIIDMLKSNYVLALHKIIIMIIITFLLNLLCERDMSIVSWIIVFVPFIFTTYVTFLLVYLFGYNVVLGSLKEPPNFNTNVSHYTMIDTSSSVGIPKKYGPTGSSDPSYQSGWYGFGI